MGFLKKDKKDKKEEIEEQTDEKLPEATEPIDPAHFGKAVPDPEQIGFSPDDGIKNTDLPTACDSETARFDGLTAEGVEKTEVKVKKKTKVVREHGGGIRSLATAVAVVTVCLVLGIIFGVVIISIGNDLFAFTFEKDENGEPISYTVVIDSEGMSASEVGKLLKAAGVIEYPSMFKLYVQLKKKDNFNVKVGTYTISAAANYDAIISALNPRPKRTEVTITFTETMTTDDIIDLFVKNGIGTREGFVDAIENYRYDYWFMDWLDKDKLSPDRYYRLDGYLYPDTYRFFSDSKESVAIGKMLSNFNKKFGEEYKTLCEEKNMTPDQAVILASMIQAEAQRVNDFTYVSAVFHNRLNSATFEGRLDSDATVQYYFRHTEGKRHDEITPEDLDTDTPYNTYKYKGLTPGAVCNPSINALRAALYPEENCPYYYFVSRYNGSMLYAKTLAEHNKNIAAAKKEREELENGVGGHE